MEGPSLFFFFFFPKWSNWAKQIRGFHSLLLEPLYMLLLWRALGNMSIAHIFRTAASQRARCRVSSTMRLRAEGHHHRLPDPGGTPLHPRQLTWCLGGFGIWASQPAAGSIGHGSPQPRTLRLPADVPWTTMCARSPAHPNLAGAPRPNVPAPDHSTPAPCVCCWPKLIALVWQLAASGHRSGRRAPSRAPSPTRSTPSTVRARPGSFGSSANASNTGICSALYLVFVLDPHPRP